MPRPDPPRGRRALGLCLGIAVAGVVTPRGVLALQQPVEAADPPPLFATHDELPVTFTADLGALLDDRRESPDRDATLTVQGSDGRAVLIGARVRTRGDFRLDRTNCSFPPLRIDVRGRDAVGTAFEGQDDLKLVSSCRPNRPTYEEMVVLEYLAYRAYGLLTDRSFRVRPIRLTLVDARGEEPSATRFAFLIEDEDAIAKRIGAAQFELEEGFNLPATAFDPLTFMTLAVFQYAIGNTDWSAVAGHNVEILDRGGVALPIPYDFDFSGLVDAPYAAPPEELRTDDVTVRVYRGWCVDDAIERAVLQRLRGERSAILALFQDHPGLESGTRRRALRYLEAFYEDIETDERAELRFLRHCRRD